MTENTSADRLSARVFPGSSENRLPAGIRLARATAIAIHIFTGFVLALLTGAWLTQSPFHRHMIRKWHRRTCQLLGIRLRLIGKPSAGTSLVVSNHISWLDIPVIGSEMETIFLSKAEVRRWPLLGALAAMTGTLFIQRGRGEVHRIRLHISEKLEAGHAVCVFPEGTSTDGKTVKRFFPQTFASAVIAGVPVQPVALRYREQGRLSMHAPFVGNDHFMAHLWNVLGLKTLEVELTFLPPLQPDTDSRTLARQAHQGIANVIDTARTDAIDTSCPPQAARSN